MSALFKNRFALLNMDDDDLEKEQEMVQQVQGAVTVPVPVPIEETTKPVRHWHLNEGRPDNVREWNIDRTKPPKRNGPFSRYAFRDDEKSRPYIPRKYAFHDESPPPESIKPVSPIPTMTVVPPPLFSNSVTPPPDDLKITNQEDFPKLSDYMRPTTPPYPPDDGWYPTLAERIKKAMENQEEVKSSEKKVINMDTVIPMPTRLAQTLPL
jgi:hypothetical protein